MLVISSWFCEAKAADDQDGICTEEHKPAMLEFFNHLFYQYKESELEVVLEMIMLCLEYTHGKCPTQIQVLLSCLEEAKFCSLVLSKTLVYDRVTWFYALDRLPIGRFPTMSDRSFLFLLMEVREEVCTDVVEDEYGREYTRSICQLLHLHDKEFKFVINNSLFYALHKLGTRKLDNVSSWSTLDL